MDQKELTPILENLIQLLKKKWFIIVNTSILAILSIIISLMLPNWYSSKASIISSGGGTSNFLSMLSGLPMGDFGLSALSEDISNYIAILESRSVQENIVKEFDLVNRYDAKDIEFAMGTLDEYVELKVSEEGNLLISVLDKDPVVARDIANALIRELDLVNRRLSREKGFFNREFLGERLVQNKNDLKNAEDNLNKFQNEYGIVDVPSQVTVSIETYAQVYAKKIENEINLSVAEAMYSSKDPTVIQYKKIDQELENLLTKLATKGDDKNILTAFKKLPDLGLEYARLYREVQLQNKIFEIILPQFEQAAMEETKSIPSLQVVDEPKVALNKAKPKRSLIVIATTLMAFLLSVIYVLFEYRTRDIRKRLKNA
jgi:tyrosine-protein kinase Etk/Wzc